MRRCLAGLAVLGIAWTSACAEPDTIDVMLVHPTGLVPRDALSEITLVLVDADTARVVGRRSAPGASLRSAVEMLDGLDLHAGSRYRILLSASSEACRRGRAVGRSRPFTHRESGDSVPITFGCADELAPTRGNPTAPRAASALVTDADGEAVSVGGVAGATVIGAARFHDIVGVTESYDPAHGRFVPGAALTEARLFPAAVALPSGPVAVIGGVLDAFPNCSTTVQLVHGLDTGVAGTLETPRCVPAAAVLASVDAIAVVGGSLLMPTDRSTDAEILDISTRSVRYPRVAGTRFRSATALVALADGASALVVGGNGGTAPAAELLRVGPQCETGACMTSVEGGPTDGLEWSEMTATYVACPDGGGSVYVVGGRIRQGDTQTPVANVWCYLDRDGLPGAGALVPAGELPEGRTGHSTASVEGPAGMRLLVVGGTPPEGVGGGLPYQDALLVPADGCSCAPLDPFGAESIPVPLRGFAILHASTVLPDGSVLVVGGVRLDPIEGGYEITASGEAAIFVPDLELP